MKTNTSIDFCVLLGLKAALQQNGLGIQYLHNKEHICTYAYSHSFYDTKYVIHLLIHGPRNL